MESVMAVKSPQIINPSMEEILASIRRIIADDEATQAPSQSEADIAALDLTVATSQPVANTNAVSSAAEAVDVAIAASKALVATRAAASEVKSRDALLSSLTKVINARLG